jgi:hypothetical protein
MAQVATTQGAHVRDGAGRGPEYGVSCVVIPACPLDALPKGIGRTPRQLEARDRSADVHGRRTADEVQKGVT